jgi:hypothetical protein
MFHRTLVSAALLATSTASAAPILFSGTGANATTQRDLFRAAIGGGTTAGANGSFGGVRREINWDGVPDALSAPNNLPLNFFNVNSPRGTVYSTPGTGVQVSASAASGTPVEFGNIDPSYPGLFAAFSPQRLFTPIGSNIVDVQFFLPGTTIPATTSAFGSIFTDVDLANTTSIQLFDENGNVLGTFFAPAAAGNEVTSFLGVQFNAGERISRVRLTNGTTALGAGVTEGAGVDLVVMDDFIYTETAVPEPTTMLLTAAGLLAMFALWRR